jgi:chromosomal replication initiator protein
MIQNNIDLTDQLVDIIAKNVNDNVRELEGALQKVVLYNSMKDSSLTEEEILNILGKTVKDKRKKVKLAQILKVVSLEFNVSVKELKGPRRTKDVAFARQVCMFMLREDFGYKLEDVARFLKRKDHTTVLHAVDKIKSKMLVDDGFDAQINMLRESINTFYD